MFQRKRSGIEHRRTVSTIFSSVAELSLSHGQLDG